MIGQDFISLVHIHIVPTDSVDWSRHLAFRDFLRSHPSVREQYGQLKKQLVAEEYRDMNEYNQAKNHFIKQTEALALAWNHSQLNEAISNHLSLWWTEESKNRITSAFGEEACRAIEEICRFADQETERFIKNGSDSSYRLTMDRIKERYDFLTEQSITKIANMAAYSWK